MCAKFAAQSGKTHLYYIHSFGIQTRLIMLNAAKGPDLLRIAAIRENKMRSFAILAAAAAFGLSTLAASAMPVDPSPGQGAELLVQVRQGCGPGGFRGPAGYCRPRYSCPPGWHPGPYGSHCFRNHYWRRHYY